MYTIKLDGDVMYTPMISEMALMDANLEIELNKTGKLTFTMLPTHPKYTKLYKMKSIVKVYQDDERIYKGRILDTDRNFYNVKRVTCEGELAFFIDTVIRPFSFSGKVSDLFRKFVEEHNKQVPTEKQFKIGRCTISYNEDLKFDDLGYNTTWDAIKKYLLDIFEGYLVTREDPADGMSIIEYVEDFDERNQQTVEFGKNLLDIDEKVSSVDIATAIIPLGARLTDADGNETDQRITIADINDGKDYVENKEAVDTFGLILKPIVYEDEHEQSVLLQLAMDDLKVYTNLITSLNISSIDLHNANCDIHAFRIGKKTNVISKPHSLNEWLLTRKLSFSLLDPTAGSMQLGIDRLSLTDISNNLNNKITNIDQIKPTDGKTSYVHTAYANSSDGKTDFSLTDSNRSYLGTYSDFNEQASTDPSKYKWSLIKGSDGKPGEDGKPGKDAAIISPNEPEDKTYLWCDISVDPPILKRWDDISQEWDVINPNADAIIKIYEDINSSLEKQKDQIMGTVTGTYYTKTDVNNIISSQQTVFNQTKDNFEFKFNEIETNTENFMNSTNKNFETTSKYIRFKDGEIIIGEVNSPFKLIESKNQISFVENDNIVAYVNTNTMFIKHAQILADLRIGSFVWTQTSDGYLVLRHI